MDCSADKHACACIIKDKARLRRELNNPSGSPNRKRKSGPRDEKALDYASWVLDKQDEDRKSSLISRLQRLAEDARNERLEAAAAVLFGAAKELRRALSRDRAASHAQRERQELWASRNCHCKTKNSNISSPRFLLNERHSLVENTPNKNWNGAYFSSSEFAAPQRSRLESPAISPSEALLALESLLKEQPQSRDYINRT